MRITFLFWVICKSLIIISTDKFKRISLYIKKTNSESKVVGPPQLYVHGFGKILHYCSCQYFLLAVCHSNHPKSALRG